MNKFPSVKNYLVSQKFLLLIFFSHESTSFTPCESKPKEREAWYLYHYLLFIAITAGGVDRYLTNP